MKNDLKYIIASTEAEFNDAMNLFQEYAASLNISLDFQHFNDELNIIGKMYGSPDGLLIVAYASGEPVACAAYRKIDMGICEVKRMYVKPAFRRFHIGDTLLKILIEHAASSGYMRMRLDTLDNMVPAIALYKKYGFIEINAYYFNPNENTVYMEKLLTV